MSQSCLFCSVVFLTLSVGLSACDATETLPEDDDLLIGVALPQTGTLGFAGQSITSGIHLAIRELETLPDIDVALVLVDTRSTISGTQDAYQTLVDMEDLSVIIGPVTSAATEAVIPMINESDIISFGPASAKAGLSAQSENLFRSSLTDDHIIPAGIRTAKANLDFKNVATFTNSGDIFSVASNELILDELQMYDDVTVAIQVSYSRPLGTPLNEGDIAGQLDNILSATPPVDAIFLSGLPEDHVTILPAAYRRKISAPFIVNFLSIAAVQSINELEPGAAEGSVTFSIWLASSPNSLSRAFVENYTQSFGMIPDDGAARGYVTTSVLLEALRQAPAYDFDSIKESLSGIENFPTIFGSFSFNNDGDAMYDPVIAVVKDNNFSAWPIVNKQ